jgi:hypothetical protein
MKQQTRLLFLNMISEQSDITERAAYQGDPGAAPDAARNLSKPQEHFWLWLILVLYFLITLAYGVINPLFEAPDENHHFFTIQQIVDSGRLPVVAPGEDYDRWVGQEAAQPPLYYLLGTALIAPFNSASPRDTLWLNKFTVMGDASSLNNINRFIHSADESFPWLGYALVIHLLRGFSTLLGLGTLLFIYGSGRLLWPREPYPALLATSLVAFLPQFNFLYSSVTNDTLVIILVSAALWQIIHLWLDRVTRSRLLLLGVTIGLAALAKNAGIVLLFYAVGVLFLLALRGEPDQEEGRPSSTGKGDPQSHGLTGFRMIVSIILYLIIPVVLISGWLWVRNWFLYGDFTATNQFVRLAGGDRNYTILQVIGESNGLWLSLFAVFGWFNLRPPDWVYWFWNGVIALAIVGALWHTLRWVRERERGNVKQRKVRTFHERVAKLLRQRWVLPLLLAGWVVVVYASLAMFALKTEATQGRLLFPALVPLALGVAYGLTVEGALRRISVILPPIALSITLYCLFFVIQPAYANPSMIAALPEDVTRLDAQLGQGLTLVGAEVETIMAEAGDPVWLTLYWKIQSELENPPEFALSIFGRDFVEVGKYHSYHGRGMYPANLWEPGQIVVDRFAVRLDDEFEVPTLGRVLISVIEGDQSIQAGEIKIIPAYWPEIETPDLAQIGDVIALSSAEFSPAQIKAGDTVHLAVQWHVLQKPDADLTTLVHIGQPDQAPLVTGDRPPLQGDYPTRVWEVGEVIDDIYTLVLPTDLEAGRYPMWIGMYDSKTLARLPVSVGGDGQPRDVYLAGWLEVEE